MDDQITAEVLLAFERTPDARLRELMFALVKSAHDFVKQVSLTEAEWARAIDFLTATGQMCDENRQEFVLLSDVLGVSSLVDAISHNAPGLTESTILGPFYVPGSPIRAAGESMAMEDEGEPLEVVGQVLSADGRPLGGAVLDVWQASTNGLYQVQDPSQPDGNLRGRYLTDGAGRFHIRTVRPTPYPIPDDGPVGALLEATARSIWRAAHIHFKVECDGYAGLVTQVFDGDAAHLRDDAVFGVRGSLVHAMQVASGSADPRPGRIRQDFVLQSTGVEGRCG